MGSITTSRAEGARASARRGRAVGRTIGVIRARMGSGRLPGRMIAPLAGRPLLALLRARVAAARVDEWWLATSGRPTDDVTEAWGFELGLRVHRGADDPPLVGLHAIAQETAAEWIVTTRASRPFVDAGLIDALLDARDARRESKEAEAIRIGGVDADARLAPPDPADAACAGDDAGPILPHGYTVEAIRRSALERIHRDGLPAAAAPHDDAATSAGAATGPDAATGAALERRDCRAPADWPSRPRWRWSIGSYGDLAMARSAFRLFGREAETIAYPEMVTALDAHPEIAAMNEHGDASDAPAGGSGERAEAPTRWRR